MTERVEAEGADAGVLAIDVSLDDYLEFYAAHFCEWIEGVVIRIAPSNLIHNELISYCMSLFKAYFDFKPIGQVIGYAFIVDLPEFPRRRREPDLFVVLDSNPNKLTDTYMDGAPNICVEVVTKDSIQRDYADKLYEYEKSGVSEYWIVDPIRKECRFYRLDENRQYIRLSADAVGIYRTPLLPHFEMNITLLFGDELPNILEILNMVKAMLR